MSPSPELSLLVGQIDGVLWIRVEGRGSFQNSPGLKAVATHAAARSQYRLVVDLQDCPLMDSTFMGTLTGLALALRGKPDGELLVLNANPRNRDLLENLGLDQIFTVDKDGSVLTELRRTVDDEMLARTRRSPLDKAEHAAHVLEAHEALADANPANRDHSAMLYHFSNPKWKVASPNPKARLMAPSAGKPQ